MADGWRQSTESSCLSRLSSPEERALQDGKRGKKRRRGDTYIVM